MVTAFETTTATETTDDDSVIVVSAPSDPNQTLQLDCYNEELNEFQKACYEKSLKEHNDIKDRLKDFLDIGGAQSIFSGGKFIKYDSRKDRNLLLIYHRDIFCV